MSNWRYFKWGATNHPGNAMYGLCVFGFVLAGLANENPVSGLLAACVAVILIAALYVSTSISVGKANKRLIEDGGDL